MKGWYLLIALFVGALIFRRSAVGDERPQSHKGSLKSTDKNFKSDDPNWHGSGKPGVIGNVYGEPGSPALLAEYKEPGRFYGALG